MVSVALRKDLNWDRDVVVCMFCGKEFQRTVVEGKKDDLYCSVYILGYVDQTVDVYGRGLRRSQVGVSDLVRMPASYC